MANQVYANNREVSCKAADGKSICAFPDVCLSPPSPPAGPIPIPYPNTGFASDTTDGSKTVKISGKEVMLKDKSYFKKSTGDEAATKSLGMGVVTHQIQGKVYFNSWSMDVKFEGENVVRHLDMTTHNHASRPGNSPPWPYTDQMAISLDHPCVADMKKEHSACGELVQTTRLKSGLVKVDHNATAASQCASKECQDARKCMLRPYKPDRCCKQPPPGQTGHHLVEVHGMCKPGKPRGIPVPPFDGRNGKEKYNQDLAPVVCANCPKGSRYYMEHGDLHAVQGIKENGAIALAQKAGTDPTKAWTYAQARQAGVDAHAATFRDSGCDDKCIATQLDAYHRDKVGIKDADSLRTEKVRFGKDPDQLKRGEDLIADLTNRRGGVLTKQAIA